MPTNPSTTDASSPEDRHGDGAAGELDVASRLRDLAAAASAPVAAAAAPLTPTQHALVEIWSRELGLAQVSLYDNFIDVGGHSIAAVRCAWQVRARFAVDLPVQAFFTDPGTIDALADIVDALRAAQGGHAAVQG